jgi:hypothetical protein
MNTNKDRCVVCKKKSLYLCDCPCGDKLCLQHRYSEFHYCEQLKKQDDELRNKLLKDVVVTPKCEKI